MNAPARPIDADYLSRDACPCCGESAARAQPEIASCPPAEALPFSEHSQFVSGYRARRVFFTYFRCEICDALFCRTFYTEGQLASLYGRQAENMADVPLDARNKTQDGYARLLMSHSCGAGSFLEIGPDIGLFAQRCAQLGSFERFWLYEPNRDVHAELARRLHDVPHTIHATMRPTSDVPKASVSTAALIHVLDHLLHPEAFLGDLAERLERDGVLLIVTHNTGSLLARLLGRRFPPFALQHPQLYSPRAMTRLLDRAGFRVVEITSAVNYFPLMHLARACFAVLGLPAPLPQLTLPLIPIRLGNMAVIARKRTSGCQ